MSTIDKVSIVLFPGLPNHRGTTLPYTGAMGSDSEKATYVDRQQLARAAGYFDGRADTDFEVGHSVDQGSTILVDIANEKPYTDVVTHNTLPLDEPQRVMRKDEQAALVEPLTPVFYLEATYEEIGRRVRLARTKKGWTQLRLAQEMGYKSTANVENIESAKKKVSLQLVAEAVRALGLEAI